MNARGFALLEWLIASAFVVAIAGALLTSIAPVRDLIDRSHQGADLTSGARTALDLVTAELREAGSNAVVAPVGIQVANLVAPVRLLQDLDGALDAQPGGAVRITRVPALAPQARLRDAAPAGENLLRLDTMTRCSTGVPACGFRNGDRALLFTDGAAEVVIVDAAFADAVSVTAPIVDAYPAGAVLCRLTVTTYGVRDGGGPASRLVRLTDGGAEQPLLDNVVSFELTGDAPDPADIARVSLQLRVQVGAADFRGPAGYLFLRGGTATSARRWLPDVELRTDVTLRNRRAAS
jgi:hypothetical protein